MRKCNVLFVIAFATVLGAQEAPGVAEAKGLFGMVKGNIIKSADKMPAEHFAFKPTDDVRSFGQLLGHIADANNMICSMAKGEKRERSQVEKTITGREELIKALNESFAYCDGAFDAMTAEKAQEKTKMFGRELSRLNVLQFNTMHDFEHYGNLVTYMRLKKVVPPSSEGR